MNEPKENALAEIQRDLEDAMQYEWDDFCGDTGHIPNFLKVTRTKPLLIEADFRHSKFAREVAESLMAKGYAKPSWRTIESAPRDGTLIMVANQFGAWPARYQELAQSGFKFPSPWRCYLLNKEHMPKEGRSAPPTHWMPLPEGPE
jgi:hypothetical protein